ncbi:hypothetical protein UNPF46_30640 [Bradyrhizobium sp. UNPF46]|uniref:hypothetical protein n=1 Tax=Bradyrhizobium sp. UNPF46 TaxID=1141168 RepID=UPI00114F70AF|nr:hypothetical protein [Bradyrhizobium sp. UNPF46]TQF27427.1 hypothetical protein UNPF46_30640 [Bradyrhizobium sp. UNPF46]
MNFDDALQEMRAGGVEGAFIFYKFAKIFYEKAGSNGLAGWVSTAFRELPPDAQLTLVCMGLEAAIESRRI